MAFEGIAAFLILIIVITVAQNLGSGEKVKLTFLTKDSALMIDTLHTVSGDVVYNYQTENYTDELMMKIMDDSVMLKRPPLSYLYIFPFRSGILEVKSEEFKIEKGKINIIDFIKAGSEISFGKGLEYTEKERCPVVDTKDENWKLRKIVIDSRYGGKYEGYVIDGIKESELNRQIALHLSTLLKSAGANVISTRSLTADTEMSDEERTEISKDASMMIVIGIGPPQENNPLNIKISDSTKSRKLGCLLINNLAKHGFDSSNIAQSDYYLLRDDVPSVLIELESLDEQIQNKVVEYGDGIYQAIKNYYE